MLMVTRLDRLARSTLGLFAIVKRIVDGPDSFDHWQSRGVSVR
jgi:hypothetical protein